MEIKNIYLEISAWLKLQDADKIKVILNDNIYSKSDAQKKMTDIICWYQNIEEETEINKQYIFNEKSVSLKEISDYMLNYIKDYGPSEGESEEDFDKSQLSAGYADTNMYSEIVSFWKNLNKYSIMSVAGNYYKDDYEIDLDGYRCYFLSRSKVYPMIFNYIYYDLQTSEKEFNKNIYNSGDSSEDIQAYYPIDVSVLKTLNVDEIYHKVVNKKIEKDKDTFNYMLNNIIKNFKDNPIYTDKVKIFESLLEKEN